MPWIDEPSTRINEEIYNFNKYVPRDYIVLVGLYGVVMLVMIEAANR